MFRYNSFGDRIQRLIADVNLVRPAVFNEPAKTPSMPLDPDILLMSVVLARLVDDMTPRVLRVGTDQGEDAQRYLLPSAIRAEAFQRLMRVRHLCIHEPNENSSHEVFLLQL